jgi:tetraacyldisaccharide 4'-kinase
MAFSFPSPQSPGGLLWRVLWAGPSFLYSALSHLRTEAYRRGYFETVRVPVPVFCLGNLTVGGSGKTPGVLWLVEELKKRGHRPAVVTRGYGRRQGAPLILVPNRGEPLPDVYTIGDEPRLLARRGAVPLAIGADRALAVERAWEEFKPDCVVMDDGFQHHRIYRDRDLVCMDAIMAYHVFVKKVPTPLLPAGPWRESPTELKRAHMLFVTRAERLTPEQGEALQGGLWKKGIENVRVVGRLSFIDNVTGEGVSSEGLKGQNVLALSGLGDPASFENALELRGAHVRRERYRDHHFFTPKEVTGVLERARRDGCRVIVTEKDRERLPAAFPALVARLDWNLEKEGSWVSVIESVFS